MMKLIVAIIQDRDTDRVLSALTSQGVRVTRVATSGGFLEQGNSTLLIGVEDASVTAVIETLRAACHRRNMFVPMAAGITDPAYGLHNQIEVEVGGATIFTFDVQHFEQM
jgi:uncharacterized protein YaaQ